MVTISRLRDMLMVLDLGHSIDGVSANDRQSLLHNHGRFSRETYLARAHLKPVKSNLSQM